MMLWMTMLPIEMKLCCRMLGTATIINCCRIVLEKMGTVPSVRISYRRRITTQIANTQLTPWHRNVAQATPATPIRNAVTKRISMPMLDSDEAARNQNGVLESPRAEKIPVADEVKGVCGMLGLEPLYLACEGRLVIFAPKDKAEDIVSALRKCKNSEKAAVIGEVTEDNAGRVVMKTEIGSQTLLPQPGGELLPRIC